MKSSHMTIRIDEKTRRQLKEIAQQEDRPVSYIVRRFIREKLSNGNGCER